MTIQNLSDSKPTNNFHSTDLLKVEPHTPTPEPVRYDKKDGQWYTHDGVDVKDTQQKKGESSLTLHLIATCIINIIMWGGGWNHKNFTVVKFYCSLSNTFS